MPDGTVVRNVPEGTTQAELQRKLAAHQPDIAMDRFGIKTPSSPEQRKKELANMMPITGGILGSLAVPGPGWGALALQSLAAGGGASGGELLAQKIRDEPLDIKKAGLEGAKQGAGNFIGGGIVKALGATASALFGSRLSSYEKAAREYAAAEGAPFPTSLVAPSPAQKLADKFVLGKIGNQQQANKVAQWMNARIGTLTQKEAVFDDVAQQGQAYLRGLLEPGETQIKQTFDDFAAVVGKDAKVPISRTRSLMATSLESLQRTGDRTNPLYAQLKTALDRRVGGGELTPTELDAMMMQIIRNTYKKGTNENRVQIGEALMDALAKDADEYAQQYGKSFLPEFQAATQVRATYRELKKVPQLLALSQELGAQGGKKGTIDWMSSLFRKGNGKALSKIREMNPDLYHDLADAWVAQNINRYAHVDKGSMSRVLDGASLRNWYVQNADTVREVMGAGQAKALDNFTQYASIMSAPTAKAGSASEVLRGLGPTGLFGTAGMLIGKPYILIPGEASAFVLTRGLSDPSSSLYKLFVSDASKEFLRRGGQVSGQVVANGKD